MKNDGRSRIRPSVGTKTYPRPSFHLSWLSRLVTSHWMPHFSDCPMAVEAQGDPRHVVSTQAQPMAAAPQKLPTQGFALAQQLPVPSARSRTGLYRRQSGRHAALGHWRPMLERRLPMLRARHCAPSRPAPPSRLAAPLFDRSASIRCRQRKRAMNRCGRQHDDGQHHRQALRDWRALSAAQRCSLTLALHGPNAPSRAASPGCPTSVPVPAPTPPPW